MDDRRKIVTRSPHRRVGVIPCPWLQIEPVEYESLLERDFIRLALLSPDLVGIRSQPFRIDVADLGTYTPDFLVTYTKSIRLVVEVKPSKFAGTEKYEKLFVAANEKLVASGFEFCVATEESIHKADRNNRAAILLRYARSHFESEAILRVLALANTCPDGISISELSDGANVSKEMVLHLIARRKLELNRKLDYSPNQLVKPILKGDQHGGIHPAAWLGCKNWSAAF